jgi:multidrug efflux pump subunit AcrB
MVSSRPGRQPVNCNSAVLCAVYIPTTFISGLQGSFYQQFSITIAAANVISVFVSLTLSPALAALLLKPRSHEPQPTLADRLAVILPWLAGDPIGVHRVDQSRLQEKLTATRRDFGLAVAFGALSIAEAARPRSGARRSQYRVSSEADQTAARLVPAAGCVSRP